MRPRTPPVNVQAVLELTLDRERRVLWASFPGTFTREDLAALDELNDVVAAAGQSMECVYDFSQALGSGTLFRDDFIERGQRPHAIAGMRRIVIASNPGILNLAKTFAVSQVMIGSSGLVILNTPDEARQALGHATLDLQPVDLAAVREFLRA